MPMLKAIALDSLTARAWREAPDETILAALVERPVNPSFLDWAQRHHPELVRLSDFLALRALA